MRRIWTDMAREAVAGYQEMEGVHQEVRQEDSVEICCIEIHAKEAADRLDKPIGRYVTLEALHEMAVEGETLIRCLAREVETMLQEVPGHILIVGLGNRMVTPDSLGPRTVEKLFVTRHIREFAPELAPKGMREVSAIVPGVLGITGLETVEVVQGVVESVQPEAVLCIDALCSERANRIAHVVQLNDSGILPGAGVGNRQQGLNKETLGVPVYAVGVPTVVHASIIAQETIRLIEKQTGVGDENNSLSDFAAELIHKDMPQMIVTPKDVDQMVEDASKRLAKGINRALHAPYYNEITQLLAR